MADYAKTIKPNDKRYWLIGSVGLDYIQGTNGLKQNKKKGMKLLERAAELGDVFAQDELAQDYYSGNFVPKCFEKARYYAKKGADQGGCISQSILGLMTLQHNCHTESPEEHEEREALRLLMLSGFQGCENSRFSLGNYYEMKVDKFEAREDWRKNILLSLYWYGKAAELESNTPRGCRALARMACQLNLAVASLWHPRHDDKNDTLLGYSHVPFITWALAKGGEFSKDLILGQVLLNTTTNPWKSLCANCGQPSQEIKQFKACARCKAFHYCNKKCQVEHWKSGHKVDSKGHWIESFFPRIREVHK